MTTPLQQAAQAILDYWDAPASLAQLLNSEHIYEKLRKVLDAELAQSVEPAAWAVYSGVLDMRKHSVWNKRGDAEEAASTIKSYTETRPLYLHPPQPQATTPSIRQHCRECANWAKAVADTKEWADGVKIGREIIKKLAAAQGEKP